MIESANTAASEETWNKDAFGFVQLLASELAEGCIQLPGFPEVVLRVQRVLSNERADVDDIVQAINAEPTLAMHIMRMANSAAFNTTSQAVHNVRAAVSRIGSRMVHAAALAFVVQQLRNAEDLQTLRDRLNTLWRRGIVVGCVAKALAQQSKAVAPDAALLVGLLHVVGKLYILTRLHRLPHLLDQEGVAEQIMEDWNGNVGKALLESWEIPAEIGEAVAQYGNLDRPLRGPVDLTDILTAASVLADLVPPSRADYLDQIQLAEVFHRTEHLWLRLQLTRENCSEALHVALEDVQHMRALFGA